MNEFVKIKDVLIKICVENEDFKEWFDLIIEKVDWLEKEL